MARYERGSASRRRGSERMDGGTRGNGRDENNTIHAVDEFRVWGYGHDYIDDAEAYVDKCAELRRKAEEAAAVAKAAKRAYIAEKVEGLPELRF